MGVTATAVKDCDGALEAEIFSKFGFQLKNLFEITNPTSFENLQGLQYFQLRQELLKENYLNNSTLLIGRYEDIKKLTGSNFDSIIPVFSSKDKQVKMVFDTKDIYFLDNLSLS